MPGGIHAASRGFTSLDAWRAAAPELAQWTWHHLVNRTDTWMVYPPNDQPGYIHQAIPVKGKLTEQIIQFHYEGDETVARIGLHASSRDHTARWFAININRDG